MTFLLLLACTAGTDTSAGDDTAPVDCTVLGDVEVACDFNNGTCTEWTEQMSADDVVAMSETCEFSGGTVVTICDRSYPGGGCTGPDNPNCSTVWNYTDEVDATEGQASCEELLGGIWRPPE